MSRNPVHVLVTAALAAATAACGTALLVADPPALDEAFELRAGQSATVEGTTLALTFVEVSLDSRCPTDVTCVWEGDAVVTLRTVLDGEERGVELHTAGDRERDGAKHVDVGPYRIHLLGLNPDPLSEQPIPGSAYRVTLRVTGGV